MGVPLSSRAKRIPPFYVMDVLEKALSMEREGRKIIHLEVGEPGLDPPASAVSSTVEALERGFSRYTHSLGIPELREEIALFYRKTYGVSVDPSQVVVSSGSSPILFMVFSALIDPGDEVIVTDPGYPCYSNVIEFLGGVPRRVPLSKEDGFQLDLDKVKSIVGGKTRAIVVASPANPTGVVMDESILEELSKIGITIVSDEIYHGLVYEGKERSILEFTENAVVINGLSKRFSMTGWRLGYAISPPDLVPALQRIQQNVLISASSFSQWGGVHALREADTYLPRVKEEFSRRREVALSCLKKEGIDIGYTPGGAFYVYIDLRDVVSDSYKFSLDLLKAEGVAVTPGLDFGPSGKGFIRITYAASEDEIKEGISRLSKFINQRRSSRA